MATTPVAVAPALPAWNRRYLRHSIQTLLPAPSELRRLRSRAPPADRRALSFLFLPSLNLTVWLTNRLQPSPSRGACHSLTYRCRPRFPPPRDTNGWGSLVPLRPNRIRPARGEDFQQSALGERWLFYGCATPSNSSL